MDVLRLHLAYIMPNIKSFQNILRNDLLDYTTTIVIDRHGVTVSTNLAAPAVNVINKLDALSFNRVVFNYTTDTGFVWIHLDFDNPFDRPSFDAEVISNFESQEDIMDETNGMIQLDITNNPVIISEDNRVVTITFTDWII